MTTPLEMLAQWNDRLSAIADAIQAKAPLAIAAVRIEAASCLLGGAVGAIAAAVACRLGLRLFAAFKESDDEVPLIIGVVGLGLVALVGGIFAMVNLFDLWNWISLFYPELWIAKRIVMGTD